VREKKGTLPITLQIRTRDYSARLQTLSLSAMKQVNVPISAASAIELAAMIRTSSRCYESPMQSGDCIRSLPKMMTVSRLPKFLCVAVVTLFAISYLQCANAADSPSGNTQKWISYRVVIGDHLLAFRIPPGVNQESLDPPVLKRVDLNAKGLFDQVGWGPAILSRNWDYQKNSFSAEECSFDRSAMQALTEEQFDHDTNSGGEGCRALSKRGCEMQAADLIRDYRNANDRKSQILYWHEGQLRAMDGDSKAAIPLLEAARKAVGDEAFGWNPYVDATVAFLRRDRAALAAARAKLAATPPPDSSEKYSNGFIEATFADGRTMMLPWPPNLDVVDFGAITISKPTTEH
jgi:hypothetical protein